LLVAWKILPSMVFVSNFIVTLSAKRVFRTLRSAAKRRS